MHIFALALLAALPFRVDPWVYERLDLEVRDLSDSKGMWFYHMLRHRIGDEAIFSAPRTEALKNVGTGPVIRSLHAADDRC